MIIDSNIHTHTTFCDGKNTPEEMVNAAIDAGLKTIGFSGHAGMPFDDRCGMSAGTTAGYIAELMRLREKYKGVIDILIGIEHEMYSCDNSDGWDFVIGSLHYLKKDGEYFPVDNGVETLVKSVEKYYGGDYDAFACDYYDTLAGYISQKLPSVVGHFDLLTKYSESDGIFREKSDVYRKAQTDSLDRILPLGIPFEVNTGAMGKKIRTDPYPDDFVLRYIYENGGEVLLSSDAHSADKITYGFDVALDRIRRAGFDEIAVFTASGKKHVGITE